MQSEPSYEQFLKKYNKGTAQIVTMRLVADLETPVSAMIRLSADEPFAFLLESVEGGTKRGRYSVIGLAPDLIWRAPAATKSKFARTPPTRPRIYAKTVKQLIHSNPCANCSTIAALTCQQEPPANGCGGVWLYGL